MLGDPVAVEGWKLALRRLRRRRAAIAGLAIIATVTVLALAAPLIVALGNHHPPNAIYPHTALDARFGTPLGPNGSFWLGADPSGRDLLTRILYGARSSLLIAVAGTILTVALGTAAGLVAGYLGRWADRAISWLIDLVLAFPALLLALGIAGACGAGSRCLGGLVRPGLPLVVFIAGVVGWPPLARIVRARVLSLRDEPFVEAARALGAGKGRILVRHILPNIATPIITYASLAVPSIILLEAGLSFLGVGIRPPQPSWGRMIADSVATFRTSWWYFVFPGIFLVATVLAFRLLSEGLRDALDPRAAA
ncbi:MAG: ABC transporter permease [Actinomycetota bacterium]